MTEQDVRAIAVNGFADAMRKSPVIGLLAGLLALELAAIVGLGWITLSDSRKERAENAEYVQMLHARLVECHRGKQR